MRRTYLNGQRFGLLTVMEQTAERQDRYVLWQCRCDCGGEIYANTKRLLRGTVKDCGCVEKKTSRRGPVAEDLTGQLFGNLTVQYRVENQNNRTRWLCRCVCGNEKEVNSRELKGGRTKSCGCGRREKGLNLRDLSNQRFGRLVALYPTEQRDSKSSVYWYCKCDCGTETAIAGDRLIYGNYRSCGCLKRENQRSIFAKLHMVDGTCVEWLEKRKSRSDNTSGFRGVDKLKHGKFRVTIGFKRQRFYLGIFDSFEAAIQVRMEAEQQIHDGFVKAYYEWQERAEQDPGWARTHKFTYDVMMDDNQLIIRKNICEDGQMRTG